MSNVRLILGYRDTLCRAGMRALLESMPGIEIVGESGQGRDLLSRTQRTRPDVVVVEDTIPGLQGLDVTARLAKTAPDVRVVIVSDHADAHSVSMALRAGAKGYVLKAAPPAALARAIRATMNGSVHLSSGVAKKLLKGPPRPAAESPLTPRQREILRMIADGWSTKQIAQILRISVKTVETHRAQLMERLGIFDVPGLVRYALRTKLVKL
jgi:DNA-binding NarL/FixJ family response regulator